MSTRAITVVRRQNGQVRLLLDNRRSALIVLGGAHDLSNNLDRLSGGKTEYIRVEVEAWKKPAREKRQYQVHGGHIHPHGDSGEEQMTGKLHIKAYGKRWGVLYVPLLADEYDGQTVVVCRNGVSKIKVSTAIKRVNLEKVVPGTPQGLREVVKETLEKDGLLWR